MKRLRDARAGARLVAMTEPRPARASDNAFLPDLCTVQALLFLLLFAQLLALVLELSAHGLAGFGWESLALTSLLVYWCVLLSAGVLCWARPLLARRPAWQAAGLSYGVIVLVTLLASALGQWLLPGGSPGLLQVLTHGLIAALLAGIALRYFYLSSQLRRREQAALAAQIEALQARMRPHFLFNSMNSIASLVMEDPAAAETAVEDLSELFRASLADATVIRLDDELALCRSYLRIEQLRLGSRLRVEQAIELPGETPILALTLQPLVENAVYHGIQLLPEGGTVTLRGWRDGRWACFEVGNPMASSDAGHRGNHLATDNLRRRLQALCGDQADLTLGEEGTGPARRFVARLRYRPDQLQDTEDTR